jgi:hypothetical protein
VSRQQRFGKRDVCIPTNVHKLTAEGNFCDESRRAHKPAIVEDYNWHTGYINKGERMLIAIQSFGKHWSGQRHFFMCWI